MLFNSKNLTKDQIESKKTKNHKLTKEEYELIKKVINSNKPHDGPKKQLNSFENIIDIKDVTKDFTNGYVINNILKKITFKIKRGDFVVVLGKSGSGKTSLMNILSGLNRASSGDVIVDGMNLINLTDKELIEFRKKNIGYIFQEYGLLESLNVYDNVKIGYILTDEYKKNKKPFDKNIINNILKDVHMYEHRKKYPSELSGGQQQRISVARALAKSPKIIFADEPTSAIDSKMGIVILDLLKKINKKNKTTIIIITHDKNIAKIADVVFVIKDGLLDSEYRNYLPISPSEIYNNIKEAKK